MSNRRRSELAKKTFLKSGRFGERCKEFEEVWRFFKSNKDVYEFPIVEDEDRNVLCMGRGTGSSDNGRRTFPTLCGPVESVVRSFLKEVGQDLSQLHNTIILASRQAKGRERVPYPLS
ncbi:hypothetical protein ACFE04_008384 [Oxalis oulophora]